jgi:predicted DNA-binding protein
MKNTYVLRVRMPDIMQDALIQEAKETGTTVSGLIRKMIETNLLTRR